MSSITYRADIDGLRALAVMTVFIFHLSASNLPGGFLGVDIFFVISGHLITQILLKEISQTGQLNLREFYKRRIKRILPSFYFIMFISLIIALFLFMPEDLVYFAKSMKGATFIKSNFYFGEFKSYFAVDSTEFPLLHTWSLSVEEQFYFIWPAILFFILKKIKPILKMLILLVSILILLGVGQGSYFSSFTRFGEILVGALAAFTSFHDFFIPKKPAIKTILALLSITMIVSSMILINKESVYPGFLSLFPCGATYLFLVSGHKPQTFLHRLFGTSFLRWVGIHSYAIYLWHWPVLAFYRYSSGAIEVGPMMTTIVLLLTFTLSFLSRRFIEIPAMGLKFDFKKTFISLFFVPGLIFLAISYTLRWSQGLPLRINQISSYINESAPVRGSYCHDSNGKICLFNKGEGKKYLLFGDSIAAYHAPILLKTFTEKNIEFYTISSNRCAPIIMDNKAAFFVNQLDINKCLKTLNAVRDLLSKQHFDAIIIAGKWSNIIKGEDFESKFKSSLRTLLAKADQVFVLGALPYFDNRAINNYRRNRYSPLLSKLFYHTDSVQITFDKDEVLRQQGDQVIQNLVKDIPHVNFFHLQNYINKKSIHLPINKEKMLYSDSYHLNDFGAKFIGDQIHEDLYNDLLLR